MKVQLGFIDTGYCTHPEGMVTPHSIRPWSPLRFPSSVGVIEHPQEGIILFDTGYAIRNLEVTRHFPERLYAWLLPMKISEKTSAIAQLKQRGVDPSRVKKVILSHFHADHIGGVQDFPSARFIYVSDAYKKLNELSRWSALAQGFLPALLPHDFKERSDILELSSLQSYMDPLLGFEKGWDIFNDGSVIGIPLNGHAEGHLGILVRTVQGDKFLIADAAWSSRSVLENQMPANLTRLVISDFKEYRITLNKLHELKKQRSDLEIIPCHCGDYHRCESLA